VLFFILNLDNQNKIRYLESTFFFYLTTKEEVCMGRYGKAKKEAKKEAEKELLARLLEKTRKDLKAVVEFRSNKKVIRIEDQFVTSKNIEIRGAEFSGTNPATVLAEAIEHYRTCYRESEQVIDRARQAASQNVLKTKSKKQKELRTAYA
jgi:hypothetical protein